MSHFIAHSRSRASHCVLHRQIKPGNIRLTPDGELTGRTVFDYDSSVVAVNVDAAMFLDDHTMAIDRSPWSSLAPTVPKGRRRAVDVVILLLLLALTAVLGWTQMMQSDQNSGSIERKNLTPPPKVESNTEDAKKEVR